MSHFFLLLSIALMFINTISTLLFEYCVSWINPGTAGGALTSGYSGPSGSSFPLSCSKLDTSSDSQPSSVSLLLSNAQFCLSQFLVLEMLSDVLTFSLSARWWSIVLSRSTFNMWVRLRGMSFADNVSAKGDHSENLHWAAWLCWKLDQDAITICFLSEM